MSSTEYSDSDRNVNSRHWYSKLVLLLWKNALLRKRHWVLTAFEVLLPTLLFVLLVTIKVLPDSLFKPTLINETTVFKVGTEELLRRDFCDNSHGQYIMFLRKCHYWPIAQVGDRKFLWGPPNPFTEDLITRVADDLGINHDELLNVTSNQNLNDLISSLYLQSNESFMSFYVGIFFHLDEDMTGDGPPTHLRYDLRLQKYWYTDLVFPYLQVPGPRNFTGDYEYVGNYEAGGFTLLQSLIDRHYTAIVAGNSDYSQSVELETQMYPYPPYVQDNAMSQLYGSALPTFVMLSLLLLSPTIIKSIVHEKETGVRELVRMMGLDGWLVWLGWFLHAFLMTLLITVIMTFFLKVKITPSEAGLFPPIIIHTDPFLLWLFLVLYGISSIAFCFAISCFFNKPTLATTLGILIWLMSYFIPRGIMDAEYNDLTLAPKIITCLLPNMAITWAFRIIAMFEGRAVGVQWTNLWETGNARDQLTPAMILIMLCVDSLLYFFITWYFDQVFPGMYGVAKPWYFPFMRSYWKTPKPIPFITDSACETDHPENFEDEPTDLKAGIVINNLRKEFPALGGGVKVAIQNVNLRCYEGQCMALLGHNGAGKTTTMSVLTGVYPPTSGRAQILGFDISTSLKQARAQVGLCPQHNTLFADLTVMEHLMFFAQLKGLSRSDAKKEAKELMGRMQLSEKMSQFGNQLSGGMKRKLCLSIALIGGSRVVILDEPSSGLDPESRRWMWDVVQRERGRRTVLVTTHHMEEADVLGDRVAVMAAGRVVCSGSTLFLKKRFGDGYSLRVLPEKGCVVTAVTSTVKSFLPGASLNSSSAQEELLYSLPDDTRRFARLLEELTNKKQFLKINHVGLSLTSMEQVFLRVCQTLDPATSAAVKEEVVLDVPGAPLVADAGSRGSAVHANGVNTDAFSDTRYLFNSQANIDSRLTGASLAIERLMSLCLKRAIYTKRKWVLLLTQGLFPVLVTLMCLFVDAAFFGSNAAEPPRDLTLDMFDWTQSFVESDNESLAYQNCYEDLFNAPFYVSRTENTTETLLNAGLKDIFHYRENYVTSALFRQELTTTVTRLMYQSIPYHTQGVGMNLISNAMLHCATNSTENTISTRNYPLPIDNRYLLDDSATTGSAVVYSMMMPIALAFLSASYLVFPLQERVSKAKQIQLMTGTSAWMLWFTSFLWDLLSYCVSSLLVLACFLLINSQGSFTQPGAPGALWLLLFGYGFGALPLAYLFSFPFSTAASGFSILALLNIVTGMIISTATWALESSKQPSLLILANILGNVSSLIPAYPASKGFKNLIDMGTHNTQCDIVEPSLVAGLCDSIFQSNVSSPFIPCCPQCRQNSDLTCFKPLSYLQWKSPGMGRELAWMFGDGVLFLLVLILVEAGVGGFIRQVYGRAVRAVWRSKTPPPRVVPADDDVVRETRAAQVNMRLPRTNAALVVEGLTKEFVGVGVTAVSNVSFQVMRGECFGLLGVNGAGKTTTFRMLTGDERPTAGNARIGNTYLSQGKNKFVQQIGYCPQFDAILEELTGEEMLSLMAGLRGMPRHRRRHAISELVALVDLTECYRRQVATFSGGNKRKLSTAMALIGDPALVFLDEPTTGVDPASRRRVWSAVRTARARGQSIILTSHSMDECEALCTRLVILTRGQLRCAGTPSHLKAKFSQGYSLQVKLRNGYGNQHMDDTKFEAALSKLKQRIQLGLPGATMTDQHRGQLAYLVPPTLSWSQLFTTMEELKQGNGTGRSLVEDYAATDPSLEHIFLAFAREGDGEVAETELETKL